jgi:hypothetical protein
MRHSPSARHVRAHDGRSIPRRAPQRGEAWRERSAALSLLGGPGGHGAQPLYNQFQHAGCVVGCGAVAWPILFGWGDRQAKTGTPYWAGGFGFYRPDGGRGANDIAPFSMTKGVRTMICELRGQLGTVCAFGAGATTRWTMPGTGS